jgi:hypothetical protein
VNWVCGQEVEAGWRCGEADVRGRGARWEGDGRGLPTPIVVCRRTWVSERSVAKRTKLRRQAAEPPAAST